MKDHYCQDIQYIDDGSRDHDSPPDLWNTETAILFELLVKRSSYIFEEDYLLLCKSSYCYLKDRYTTVSKERKSDDKISKRHLQVDGIESNEETDGSRTCITHKHLAGEEVEYQVRCQTADHYDADRNTVHCKRTVEECRNGQSDYRKHGKRS